MAMRMMQGATRATVLVALLLCTIQCGSFVAAVAPAPAPKSGTSPPAPPTIAPTIATPPVTAPTIAPVAPPPTTAPVAAPTVAVPSPVAAAPSVSVPAPAAATPTATPVPVAAPTTATPAPVAAPTAATPAPVAASGPTGSSVDCSNAFASLQTCFAFVSGNDSTPPTSDCCAALLAVHESQPVCLCQLLQLVTSGDPSTAGLNATRGLELPALCKVNADVNSCPALLGTPVASPSSGPAAAATAPGSGSGEEPAAAPTGSTTPPGSGAPSSMSRLNAATVLVVTTMLGFAALPLIF